MAEPNNEPKPEPTPTPEPDTGNAGEPDAKLRGVMSEASRWKSEFEKRDAELADLKAKMAADNDAAEKKRLEEQGKWQELAEKEKANREAIEAKHAQTMKRMSLDTALLQAGIQNEYTREGIITRCPAETETADYIAQLQKDQPDLFKAPEMSAATRPAQGATSSSGTPPQDLDERLVSDDPKVRSEARKEKFEEQTGLS